MTKRRKKTRYIVLVPFSDKGSGGLYRYESRGGIFSSIRKAQTYIRFVGWTAALVALLTDETEIAQGNLIAAGGIK